MKPNYKLLFLFTCIFSLLESSAINNSIAFVYGGDGNCTFTFRDTAGTRTFTPTTYYWDFGDGSNSSSQNATHQYTSNGTYTVKHVISDGSNTDSAVLSILVDCKINKPTKANFDYLIEDTINNFKVYFSDQSDGNILAYSWDFGDGNSSTQPNPTHTYSATGTYPVIFKVYDGTMYDSMVQIITIKPFDSCAVFKNYFYAVADTNCKNIAFISTMHYTATSYSWDFGDSSTSSAKSPIHLYNKEGYFDVTLIASSSICADTVAQRIRVTCRSCYSVTASIDLQIDSSNPSKANLYNYSTGPIASHYWDFGDGSTSTAATPNHTYTAPGMILLSYVVTDTSNCSDTAHLTFEIDSNGNIKRGFQSLSLQVIDRTNGQTSSIQKTVKQETLKIYPQPANETLNFVLKSGDVLSIEVYNMQGKQTNHLELNNEKTILDISNWSAGLYIFRCSNGDVYRCLIE